jgi:hypothetical protein
LVPKINTDTSGKAISVSYFDVLTEMEYEQPGDIFVLGAYELNNVRLMLLSGIGEAYNPDTETGLALQQRVATADSRESGGNEGLDDGTTLECAVYPAGPLRTACRLRCAAPGPTRRGPAGG